MAAQASTEKIVKQIRLAKLSLAFIKYLSGCGRIPAEYTSEAFVKLDLNSQIHNVRKVTALCSQLKDSIKPTDEECYGAYYALVDILTSSEDAVTVVEALMI